MSCKKVVLSNESSVNWIYFNFRRCSDNYFESQYAIPPLERREINYLDETLESAFENGYQIDPDGFYLDPSPTPTPSNTATIPVTPSSTPEPTPTCTNTPTYTSTPTPSIPQPFSCNDLPDLWAWYISTSGVTSSFNGNYDEVSTWDDTSINGNNLTTVLTNTPELALDTVGTLSTYVIRKSSFNIASMATSVNFPNTTTSGVSIFIVAKIDSISVFGGDVLIMADDGISISDQVSPDRITGRVGTNTPTFLDGVYTTGTYLTIRLVADTTTQSLSFNNSQVDSSNDVSSLFLNNRKFRILANASSQPINASIAEIVVYTRNLNGTEITQVENYLKNKYNHY